MKKTELQKIVDESALLEKAKLEFALKWVERVVFWVIVLVATAVAGVVIRNYIIHFL
jgi:hypothetical protein